MTTRGSRFAASFFLLIAVLGACAPTERRPDAAAGEDTVTVLYIGGEEIWHPSWSVSAHHLVFLRLFRWTATGEIEGELARDWEASDDHRTWTYHLRTDVRWHDGVPFTAHDIAFTHALLSDPQNGYPWDIRGRVVTVIDDSTVQIRYDRPGFPEPMESWFVYYPKHLLEHLDARRNNRWDFWSQPVGNGPYRYVRHIAETMVELERNPDYYGPEPAIERVFLKFGSPNGRLELQAGNVDVSDLKAISLRDAFRLAEEDENLRVYYVRDDRAQALFWNHRHPFFSDRRLRQALTYALDREVFARVLDLPADLSFVDVPQEATLWNNASAVRPPPPMPYDPVRADSLLSAAGWLDVDGDGVRERGADELRFALLVGADMSRLAVLAQDQLRAIGADVAIETLAGQLIRNRVQEGDFDATIGGGRYGYLLETLQSLAADTDNPEGSGRRPRSPYNFEGLEAPELIAVAGALDTAFAPESRTRLHASFWRLWQEEIPATYLVNNALVTVAHRRIRGLSSPSRVFATTHMHELWIENDP